MRGAKIINSNCFSLKEFCDRCMEPVYDLETGELIDAKKLKESKDLEVLTFWVCKDGIGVKLENEDMEG